MYSWAGLTSIKIHLLQTFNEVFFTVPCAILKSNHGFASIQDNQVWKKVYIIPSLRLVLLSCFGEKAKLPFKIAQGTHEEAYLIALTSPCFSLGSPVHSAISWPNHMQVFKYKNCSCDNQLKCLPTYFATQFTRSFLTRFEFFSEYCEVSLMSS